MEVYVGSCQVYVLLLDGIENQLNSDSIHVKMVG